tara:strand:+ start:169 stop:948 length:780 start_codon:yes stop_codon:yes gene_type:complete
MSDDEDLVVRLDIDDEVEAAARRGSQDDALEWSGNVAVSLIIVGSLMGLWFGALLFAADPQDVLENPLFIDQNTATVNGQLLSAVDEANLTGGDPIEGIQVILLNIDDEPTGHSAYTNRDGRFSMLEVPQEESYILKVAHSGNKTLRITFNPGEQADISLTMTPGEGVIEEDLRRDSHLESAVLLASVVASLTVISALFGLAGAAEARRGKHYRRTQYLCGIALFSRGGIFIGPMLILAGMGMLSATKKHFEDSEEDEN